MNKNLKRNLSILTLFFALTVIGCGKGEIAGIVGEANKTRIQRAVNSYLLYQRRMLKPPKNKEDLVEFIKTNQKIDKNLELMGISRDGFEENLISERDENEYFFRWGTLIKDRAPDEPLVFETVGVDGKYQIGWVSGTVEEYEKEEYDRLKKGRFKREKIAGPDLKAEANRKALDQPVE
jgi:hypothetical protein